VIVDVSLFDCKSGNFQFLGRDSLTRLTGGWHHLTALFSYAESYIILLNSKNIQNIE